MYTRDLVARVCAKFGAEVWWECGLPVCVVAGVERAGAGVKQADDLSVSKVMLKLALSSAESFVDTREERRTHTPAISGSSRVPVGVPLKYP